MNLIPNTDLKVFPVTLGTMTYGSPVAFDDAVRLTRYALSCGINLIDTANMYEGYNRFAGSSGGVAEEIVGEAVSTLDRGSVLIATKLGMKVGTAPEDEGTSAAAVHKQLSASLKRMRTDYVDLYYLHRPDDTAPMEQTLAALQEEMQAGRIRHYGVSNYSADQLQALLNCADRNHLPRPVVCQPPLSLLKQGALETLLPLCEKERIAVIPYQIYQGGLLTGKYHRGQKAPAGSRADEKPDWVMELTEELFDKLEGFAREAESRQLTMTQYALRWTLEQKAVVSAIVGVKNERQIDDAVGAFHS